MKAKGPTTPVKALTAVKIPAGHTATGIAAMKIYDAGIAPAPIADVPEAGVMNIISPIMLPNFVLMAASTVSASLTPGTPGLAVCPAVEAPAAYIAGEATASGWTTFCAPGPNRLPAATPSSVRRLAITILATTAPTFLNPAKWSVRSTSMPG